MLAAAPTSALTERLAPPAREVVERHRSVLVEAAGDGSPAVDLGAGPAQVAAGSWARIWSCGACCDAADLPSLLATVTAALTEDGRFVFVEPVAAPGWPAAVAATATAGRGVLEGLHVHRDLVAAMRAAGLVVPDLARFEVEGVPFAARHWVAGIAHRRYPDPTDGSPDPHPRNVHGGQT